VSTPTTCWKWIRKPGPPMNNFYRKFRSNFFPVIVFSAIVLGCGLALYLYHPASPHHDRYSFVVRYESIGTLSPGNRVEVRGITKGEITKVDLTEDAVYVTARVLADTKIPKNSEYRLKTAGLMGERELSVLTGDSKDLIADGDTVMGYYEEGANAVGRNLAIILSEVDSLVTILKNVKDTLTVGATGKRAERVISKADNLVETTTATVRDWIGEADTLLSKCEGLLNQAKSTLEPVSAKTDETVKKVDDLVARLDSLIEDVKGAKGELDVILSKLETDDNTTGLILSKKGAILKEVDEIGTHVDALIKDIRKSGLKLNVDIF